ncbi:hypothetical protein [Acidianus sp. HS-5]|uniref:hypothetical protein n=1 Tax=Acidianus sp. HS-5 TaxID=2886040 RepID=UPI001F2D7F9C|nr:hypothetical protein [Acidianus sp. HS-5]BDC17782.1 hypothetical protein HS5_06720 [Acidianus sp. HS-5]
MLAGFFIIYISPTSPDYFLYSVVGNIIFWSSLLLFLLKTILRRPLHYLKKGKLALAIFFSYLSVHYVVYSIVLERLLTGLYGILFTVTSPFITFSFTPLYPETLYTAAMNLVFNPAIAGGFPPNYYFELSLYAMVMGLIIAILVTGNIMRVLEISSRMKRAKVILIAPLLGIIGGGSCCISIPILLTTVIPAANSLLFLPIGDTALFLAYILLPPITAIGLKLNYDALFPKPPKEFRIVSNNVIKSRK